VREHGRSALCPSENAAKSQKERCPKGEPDGYRICGKALIIALFLAIGIVNLAIFLRFLIKS
jgi:hypothetical protein